MVLESPSAGLRMRRADVETNFRRRDRVFSRPWYVGDELAGSPQANDVGTGLQAEKGDAKSMVEVP
jgi:hypothetical protein